MRYLLKNSFLWITRFHGIMQMQNPFHLKSLYKYIFRFEFEMMHRAEWKRVRNTFKNRNLKKSLILHLFSIILYFISHVRSTNICSVNSKCSLSPKSIACVKHNTIGNTFASSQVYTIIDASRVFIFFEEIVYPIFTN